MKEAANIEQNPLTEDQHLQLVAFRLGREEYAVNILNVQEINRFSDIMRVPNSPLYIKGVINLRGRVIPVMNLRTRFDLQDKTRDRESRIMVIDVDGMTFGILVDSVTEVLSVSSDGIKPPPALTPDKHSEYIKGISKNDDRLIILLDLEKLSGDNKGIRSDGNTN